MNRSKLLRVFKRRSKPMLSPDEFEALPLWQRRVLIAKDVIAQLKYKAYKPCSSYLDIQEYNFKSADKNAREELINGKLGTCRVCARGAVFLSMVRYRDKLTVKEMMSYQFDYEEYSLVAINATRYMNREFSEEQQALIESAYEGSHFGERYISYITAHKAIAFGQKYPDQKKRLIAICQNIINNKGLFVP